MKNLVLSLVFITMSVVGFAQDVAIVNKSIITEIDESGQQFYLHLVQKGQTLYSISKVYNISYEEIFQYNPEVKEGLGMGAVLRIPVNAKTESASYNAETVDSIRVQFVALPNDDKLDYLLHIVQPKETLFSLSKEYQTEIAQIKRLNPELGDYPKVGQVLKMPKLHLDKPEPAIDISIHKVLPKETLYGISKQYSISIENILRFNPWLSERGIQPSDLIKIPNELPTAEIEIPLADTNKANNYIEYKVHTGENLYRIAKKYGVSIEGLLRYDSTLTLDIQLGQMIKIPLIKPTTSFIIHKSDETVKLKEIAKKYNVPYRELKKINPELRRKVGKDELVRIPIDKEELISILQEERKIDSVTYLPVKDTVHIKTCMERLKEDHNLIKVALLLPLYLDNMDKEEMQNSMDLKAFKQNKSFRFLPFYESFLLAVDSITRDGAKVEISVYDVDNSLSKTVKLLNNMDMLEMDLIVGPLFKKPFIQLSNFAKLHEINIINPLTKRNSIIENNNKVFKLMPDKRERRYVISASIQETFPNSNVVIIQPKVKDYETDVHYLTSYFYFQRNREANAHSFYQVLKTTVPDTSLYKYQIFTNTQGAKYEVLARKLSSSEDNVVILLSDDKAFLKETVGQLKKYLSKTEKAKIHLYTYSNPEEVNEISSQTFIDLDTYFVCESFVDYTNPDVKRFVNKCRATYNFEPTQKNYAFTAFDAGLFFLNAIHLYGKDFQNCLSYVPQRNLSNEFHFEHNGRHGYNNVKWHLLHLTKTGVEKVE